MGLDLYIYQKIKEHLPFDPSSDQDLLFQSLSAFLTGSDSIFILNGYAGTGKTTAMAALVGALREMNRQTVLLAPTGRSAKVLMGYAGAPAHTITQAIFRQKPPAGPMKRVSELLNCIPTGTGTPLHSRRGVPAFQRARWVAFRKREPAGGPCIFCAERKRKPVASSGRLGATSACRAGDISRPGS